MTYAAILAGGNGSRMGATKMPKQFLSLGGKPIIIHTLEQFLLSPDIDKILVIVPKKWMSHTEELLEKHLNVENEIFIVEGGDSRNGTIVNGCKYIEENFGLNDDDLIVTHDAVRPFVTQRIITDNVKLCRKYDAIDTVIPAVDTIVESKDGEVISSIPVRKEMYQGQTPQSFGVKSFMDLYESLTEEEKEILTDACKIFVMKDKKVGLAEGEVSNMKITMLEDLEIANAILRRKNND